MIYFTELDNLPTFDARGEYMGRLTDLAVNPSENSLQVAAYLVKPPTKSTLCISHEQIQSVSVRAAQTRVAADQIRSYGPEEGLLRVKKDVLDQQIIDVNNRKVVRVNDVDFDIQPMNGHTGLRIVAVNVGLAAAVRRLLQGTMAKHTIRRISGLLPSKTIPWEFVNLIETDPARRVRLRISYNRVAELHPADIADILEELSRDDQQAVIESLDDQTAAKTLSEVPTRLQAALLESIPPEKAADIVEEMPPDEAADVLQEMQPETSEGLLAGMEKDGAQDVRELLAFEEKTAGALMTNEFVVVGELATVEGALATLKNFQGPLESVHAVHLIDSSAVLTGVVPVARLLLVEPATLLKDLSSGRGVAVEVDTDDTAVIDLFHKYNLLSLPVLDEKGHLIGVITADDVIELMLSRA